MQKITKISVVLIVIAAVAVAVATGVFNKGGSTSNGLDDFLAFIPSDSPLVMIGQSDEAYSEMSNRTLLSMNPKDVEPLLDLLDGNEEGSGAHLLSWLLNDYMTTAAEGGQDALVERYGINPTGPYALYVSGVAPVARMSISGSEPIRALLAEAEEETGVSARESTLGSATLYAWTLNEADPELELGLSVDESSMTLSLLNGADSDEARMIRFARQPVTESLKGSERVEQLRTDYADANQFMGYLDFEQIVGALLQPEQNSTGRELKTWFPEFEEKMSGDLTAACRADYVSLVSHMPRLTFGSEAFSINGDELSQDLGFLWHIENQTVVTSLEKLQGFVPGYARSVDDKLGAYAMGIDVSQLVPVLTEFWTQFTTAEFQCEQLQAAQQQALSYNPGMLAMGTAMVDSVRGAGVALFNLERSSATPAGVDGSVLVSVSSEDPSAIAGMLTSFVPQFMGLQIPADGTPVEIQDPLGLGGIYAAIKGKHLVLYRGEAAENAAEELAGESLEANGLSALALNLREPLELFNTLEPAVQTAGAGGCAEFYTGLLSMTATPVSFTYQEALAERGWRGKLAMVMDVPEPVSTDELAGNYELSLMDNTSCNWDDLGEETLNADNSGGFVSTSADGECDSYQSEFSWKLVGSLLSQDTSVERQREACDSDWDTMENAEGFECGVLANTDDGFYCATMTDGVTELYRYDRL